MLPWIDSTSYCVVQKYIELNLHDGESACTILHLVITRWGILTRRRGSMVCHFPSCHHTLFSVDLNLGLLIDKEPSNMQALSLASLIDKGVTRGSSLPTTFIIVITLTPSQSSIEGYIGMALAGGAAAIGAILVGGLIRRAARK